MDSGSELFDPLTALPIILLPDDAMEALFGPQEMPSSDGGLGIQTAAGEGRVSARRTQDVRLVRVGRTVSMEALVARAPAMERGPAIIPLCAVPIEGGLL